MIKLIVRLVVISSFLVGCKSLQTTTTAVPNQVEIDLVNIKDDQVMVTYQTIPAKNDKTIFYIPKTVPGTYSLDNYGKYVTEVKAFQKNGESLSITQIDENSWEIQQATKLHKITYLVNDTFDTEIGTQFGGEVFSPAGTNILDDENFVLNLHGFVGYFKDLQNQPYSLSVLRDKDFKAATSHSFTTKTIEIDTTAVLDNYYYTRYGQVTDDPIVYGKLDNATFKLNDIEVLLSVYSPNNVHTAQDLLPSMKRMMEAQKKFMGSINSTKKYSILLYLSTFNNDAKGFGALEHNNSTVVVMPEQLPLPSMEKYMIDIVSHEFFHVIAPLTVHSEEIHYFDYNNPKMSQHLWLYEGTTEYFAQYFQVTENLVSDEVFYDRMNEKIANAKNYDDTMSFTEMSKNIYEEPFKSSYVNVYEKGALISMCLDIIIREQSNGEKGLLDIIKVLSNTYGSEKPFVDANLIAEFTALTYPEVGAFLNEHVVGKTPIDYNTYLNKVGLVLGEAKIATEFFSAGETGYIVSKFDSKELIFMDEIPFNSFLTSLKVEPNDILVSINNKTYDADNAMELFTTSATWQPGMNVNMLIKRGGMEFITKTVLPEEKPSYTKNGIVPIASPTEKQLAVRKAWLQKN